MYERCDFKLPLLDVKDLTSKQRGIHSMEEVKIDTETYVRSQLFIA